MHEADETGMAMGQRGKGTGGRGDQRTVFKRNKKQVYQKREKKSWKEISSNRRGKRAERVSNHEKGYVVPRKEDTKRGVEKKEVWGARKNRKGIEGDRTSEEAALLKTLGHRESRGLNLREGPTLQKRTRDQEGEWGDVKRS